MQSPTLYFEDQPVTHELLIRRKKSTFTKVDMNPGQYPYDYIKRKTQVRTLLNTLNRQRWQKLIQDDLVGPGHLSISPRSEESAHAATDIRYASNYREHRQTVDVDR